jgi:HemY protein
MLSQVYQELQDWQALIELLPDLKKRRILSEDQFAALQRHAWCQRLVLSSSEPAATSVVWQHLPRDLKRDPQIVTAYTSALQESGAAEEAEVALRSALQQNWDDQLIELFGQVTGADPERQLVVGESWLKERPNDPVLLLALGRICLMNSEWAKAREYLEASLRLQRTAEVYGELGRLCVALGESERGAEYLAHATVALPALPQPA